MNAALVLTIGLAGIGPEGSSTTARELLQAMRDRYDGKWYRSLTFVQENTQTRPDGTVDHSTWREWLAMPGRLRIEFVPSDSGAGMLFTADSHYVFRADSMVMVRPFVHPLLVLGFDVYFHPVERTVALLERHGFDLSVIHEATWAGRPVYVVGARAGDVHTRQFWIDRERLVFVRMLEPAPGDSTRTSEVRFNKYAPLAGGWIAPEVEFLLNGERRFLEEYRDVRTDVAVAADLFVANAWKSARRSSR